MLKRVASGGAHLRSLAPGLRTYTAPKKRRSGGEPLATLCRFTGLGIEPQTSRTESKIHFPFPEIQTAYNKHKQLKTASTTLTR